MAISHQKVPPDGWQFKETKTNITVIALNYDDLVKSVQNHRKSNNIEMGDVKREIDDQLSKAHPQLVI